MAAVQPAQQGMPQQQGNNPAMGGQGQSVLPQGMTKEQVQQMYQKYQAMKRQGVPDTDPEMMKART
ncbi:hypothetical protein KC353_g20298, partial [Hortaea werneckii]